MSTFRDLEDDPGPVVVRRPVYDAGLKLEAEAGTDPAFITAEKKADDLRAAGKTQDAAFWKEVYEFLMRREEVAADVETVILEEGETYNWNRGRVERSS